MLYYNLYIKYGIDKPLVTNPLQTLPKLRSQIACNDKKIMQANNSLKISTLPLTKASNHNDHLGISFYTFIFEKKQLI